MGRICNYLGLDKQSTDVELIGGLHTFKEQPY